MIFWTVVITLFYLYIIILCMKDIRKRGYKAQDKRTIAELTVVYVAVLVGIWVVYPEDWF